MRPYYDDGKGIVIYHGDCLDVLPTLPAASVDLIATDPPYYRVKGDAWDNQWPTVAAFLAWLERVLAEFQRILKPNGSLYLFASPKVHEGVSMAARVEVLIGQFFDVIQRVTWRKPAFSTKAEMTTKESLRMFFPASEAIIFAEQKSGMILRQHRLAAGVSSNEAALLFPSATGGATGCVRNWELGLNIPTREQYARLATLYPLPPYDDAIRPFGLSADVPYTDTWDFATVNAYPGKHPCEKPVPLMEHIIRTSSRPGAVVLDAFCGSGATGEAARNLGRRFIGIEKDATWAQRAADRVARRLSQEVLAL